MLWGATAVCDCGSASKAESPPIRVQAFAILQYARLDRGPNRRQSGPRKNRYLIFYQGFTTRPEGGRFKADL